MLDWPGVWPTATAGTREALVVDDERFLALSDGQRRSDERLDQLAEVVDELANALDTLSSNAGAGSSIKVPWWPDLDPQARAAAWADLVTWLNEVILPRHVDLGRILTPCWSRHAGVVDELSMLQATWTSAYRGPRASPTAVAEWLDRWFPNARRRIEDDLKDCQRRSHDAALARSRDGTSLPVSDEPDYIGGVAPGSAKSPSTD